MKMKRSSLRAAALLIAALLFLSTGCQKSAVTTVEKRTEKGYALPQIMIIAMSDKNSYEDVCSSQIWDLKIPGGSETFAEYLTGQIEDFMEDVKIMNLLAEEQKIDLTSEEKSAMAAAAEEYYNQLAKEDIEYMGVTEEDARAMFEEYCRAEKLVDELTKDVNLEVSDSEAKVITIIQAQTPDQSVAEQLRLAAMAESADFEQCAENAGLTVTKRILGREEEEKEFENAVFSLLAGEVSEVITGGDGAYYVVKCISDYDEAATIERKETIYQERKRKVFKERYDSYKTSITLTYPEALWENLDLGKGEYAKQADFFETYKKYIKTDKNR